MSVSHWIFWHGFQEVHPDEFTASKTPSYPSLRMALSVASHMGWPIERWDVSTAFLYARLFGDRDTDLGGNEIFMRPPKILVDTEVVETGVVWKIKKALYGSRTSPIAWETERDNTLKSLTWIRDKMEFVQVRRVCGQLFHSDLGMTRMSRLLGMSSPMLIISC